MALDRRRQDFPRGERDAEHRRDRQGDARHPPAQLGAEPGERTDIPRLQNDQQGGDIDDDSDQPAQDGQIAVGALFEGREARLQVRCDGEAALARALGEAHQQRRPDDHDEAQCGRA